MMFPVQQRNEVHQMNVQSKVNLKRDEVCQSHENKQHEVNRTHATPRNGQSNISQQVCQARENQSNVQSTVTHGNPKATVYRPTVTVSEMCNDPDLLAMALKPVTELEERNYLLLSDEEKKKSLMKDYCCFFLKDVSPHEMYAVTGQRPMTDENIDQLGAVCCNEFDFIAEAFEKALIVVVQNHDETGCYDCAWANGKRLKGSRLEANIAACPNQGLFLGQVNGNHRRLLLKDPEWFAKILAFALENPDHGINKFIASSEEGEFEPLFTKIAVVRATGKMKSATCNILNQNIFKVMPESQIAFMLKMRGVCGDFLFPYNGSSCVGFKFAIRNQLQSKDIKVPDGSMDRGPWLAFFKKLLGEKISGPIVHYVLFNFLRCANIGLLDFLFKAAMNILTLRQQFSVTMQDFSACLDGLVGKDMKGDEYTSFHEIACLHRDSPLRKENMEVMTYFIGLNRKIHLHLYCSTIIPKVDTNVSPEAQGFHVYPLVISFIKKHCLWPSVFKYQMKEMLSGFVDSYNAISLDREKLLCTMDDADCLANMIQLSELKSALSIAVQAHPIVNETFESFLQDESRSHRANASKAVFGEDTNPGKLPMFLYVGLFAFLSAFGLAEKRLENDNDPKPDDFIQALRTDTVVAFHDNFSNWLGITQQCGEDDEEDCGEFSLDEIFAPMAKFTSSVDGEEQLASTYRHFNGELFESAMLRNLFTQGTTSRSQFTQIVITDVKYVISTETEEAGEEEVTNESMLNEPMTLTDESIASTTKRTGSGRAKSAGRAKSPAAPGPPACKSAKQIKKEQKEKAANDVHNYVYSLDVLTDQWLAKVRNMSDEEMKAVVLYAGPLQLLPSPILEEEIELSEKEGGRSKYVINAGSKRPKEKEFAVRLAEMLAHRYQLDGFGYTPEDGFNPYAPITTQCPQFAHLFQGIGCEVADGKTGKHFRLELCDSNVDFVA